MDLTLEQLEQMLKYNIDHKASKKTIAEIRKAIKDKKAQVGPSVSHQHIRQAYKEDLHRGEGGGSSEGAANSAALKTLMKDNRIRETKYTQTQWDMVKNVTQDFVDENNLDHNFRAKEEKPCS